MSGLPRRSTVKQMSRIRSVIKKAGGDIGDKTVKGAKQKEKNLPNSLWIDNPHDREIDTINNHVKLEVESFTEFKTNEEYANFNFKKSGYKPDFIFGIADGIQYNIMKVLKLKIDDELSIKLTNRVLKYLIDNKYLKNLSWNEWDNI